MLLDKKLSKLLSEFFLDISKASFIATFITAPNSFQDILSILSFLTRGIFSVILFMYLAWIFKEK